jgi:HD-like signal output (HDOD) protein
LSLANSAYYKHTKKPIETLAKAIAVLGLDNINCIVIPLLVKGIFRVNLYHFKLFGSLIWQHSLETAVLCKMLSKDADNISQFHCYLMGLVHDLGKVVVFECISQQLNEIDSFNFLGSSQFKQALAKHSLLLSVEISKNWQLPIKIQDSLEQQVKGNEDVLSHILSLANKISEANLLIENNKLTLVSAIEEISNENISEDQVTLCLNKLMELPPL